MDRLSASEAQKLNAMPQMQSRADAALFNFFFLGTKKTKQKNAHAEIKLLIMEFNVVRFNPDQHVL